MADAEDAVVAAMAARETRSNAARGTWKRVYKGFLFGLVHLRLQVFNRETANNMEFAMSCYTATVAYRRVAERFFYARSTLESGATGFFCVAGDRQSHGVLHRKSATVGAYYATYEQDGRGLVQETVVPEQLRMVPQDIAGLPSSSSLFCDETMRAEDFTVGDGVEIQWKRQEAHPYGWWYGEVESVWQDTKEETGQVGDLLHVAIPGAARSTPVLIPETGRAVEVIPRAGGATGATGGIVADLVNAHLESQGRGAAAKAKSVDAPEQWPQQAVLTKITVVFPQYLEDSPWRRVTVVLGTTHAVRSLGGYLGGIRPAAGAAASLKERAVAKHVWERNRAYLPLQRIL